MNRSTYSQLPNVIHRRIWITPETKDARTSVGQGAVKSLGQWKFIKSALNGESGRASHLEHKLHFM